MMELWVLSVGLLSILSTAAFVVYLVTQRRSASVVGVGLLGASFLLLTLYLLTSWVTTKGFPARNLYETLLVAAWAVAGTFLGLQFRLRLSVLGVLAAPMVMLLILIATQLSSDPVVNKPIFNSFWLVIHVAAILMGEALLALACGAAILYLLQERAIKQKRRGFFYERLPSLERLDATGYIGIVSGFSLMTFGLVIGMIYARSVWGHFWTWNSKEVWSGITWLLYAVLLHGRLTVGWRGRRSAVMAIVGFVIIILTFIATNYWMEGHHGQFTRF